MILGTRFSLRIRDYTNCNAANSLIINIQESISTLSERVPRTLAGSINYRFPLRLRNDLLTMCTWECSGSNFRLECRGFECAARAWNLWHKFLINAPHVLSFQLSGNYVYVCTLRDFFYFLLLFEFMRIIHRETDALTKVSRTTVWCDYAWCIVMGQITKYRLIPATRKSIILIYDVCGKTRSIIIGIWIDKCDNYQYLQYIHIWLHRMQL